MTTTTADTPQRLEQWVADRQWVTDGVQTGRVVAYGFVISPMRLAMEALVELPDGPWATAWIVSSTLRPL